MMMTHTRVRSLCRNIHIRQHRPCPRHHTILTILTILTINNTNSAINSNNANNNNSYNSNKSILHLRQYIDPTILNRDPFQDLP